MIRVVLRTLLALVLLDALTGGILPAPASAGGPTNDGSHYRYPWTPYHDPTGSTDTTRYVTQGQGQGGHQVANGDYYAVDWASGSSQYFAYAANVGQLRCRLDPNGNWGYFVVVYDAIAGDSSIYAHLANCWPWSFDTWYPVEQGHFVALTDNTGHSEGNHLHFQVMAGVPENTLTSKSFVMDGQSSFSTGETDGPSDDVGVGYTQLNPLTLDSVIVSGYRSAGGGTPGAWWNIGATYATGVGQCIYSNNPFVHTCNTIYGAFTVQNYVRWDGRLSAVARNQAGSAAYLIASPIWKLLGTNFRGTDVMTNQLGPPYTVEASGVQYFSGGSVVRSTTRARQDVYLNGTWRATYYFQTAGTSGECYDVDGSGAVTSADLNLVAFYFLTHEYGPPNSNGVYFSPAYDLDRDGIVSVVDLSRVAAQQGLVCAQ